MQIKIGNITNFIRKIRRFGFILPTGNLIITYLGKLIPQNKLTKFVEQRHQSIENQIISIIDTGIFKYTAPSKSYNPKSLKIWVLWLQGESQMPPIVKLCLQSIQRNRNDHEVVVLSNNNLKEYIKLPKKISTLYEQGKISAAHYSDIIRMYLLSRYGGFWMDATMYLISPIPEKIFSQKLFTVKTLPFGNFVSKCRWTGFFMASEPGGTLPTIVYNLFVNYWSKEDTLIDYFLIDYAINLAYKHNNDVRNLIDSLEYTNPQIHGLSNLLISKYNQEQFNNLTKKTSCFKLSWKNHTQEELDVDKTNYYHYLKKIR